MRSSSGWLSILRRTNSRWLPCSLLVATLVCTWETDVRSEDWPQFRGPNCTGVSRDAHSLPTRFSADSHCRWKADVGDGIGGAVVASGRLFVSGMTDEQTVSLFAFDAATGKQLWRRDWETGPLNEIHSTNSHASTTPAADGQRVYFYFSSLGLISVDASSGRDLWIRELPQPFFVFKWGPGMSPVLYRDMVLFCQDDDLNPALYAFNQADGTLIWKDERRDMAVNYSHPVVSTVNGVDEIVVAGTGRLIGYDPISGERRWFAQVLLRNIKTTPVCADGTIYVSVQSSAIANQWLAAVDRDEKAGNNDNRIDKAEIARFVGQQATLDAFLKNTFDRGDLNHDGYLEGRELDAAFLDPDNFAGADFRASGEAAAEQFILAVRGGGRGDVTKTHLLWRHKTKSTDHIASPLITKGRMFLIKEGGISTLFGTHDGKPLRDTVRIGNGGGYFASPILSDDKIYLASLNGNVTVLQNDAELSELAVNEVGEPIAATPAVADGRLFIRTRSRVFCFQQ